MTYISVGLRILLSIAFLGAGGAKLAGVEMMVMTFDQIGWGQGFRYLTGAIEVIGVMLLWLPRRQVIGAAVLGATMVGGVLTHWFYILTAPKFQKFSVVPTPLHPDQEASCLNN
jgi:putative oxidoreductase